MDPKIKARIKALPAAEATEEQARAVAKSPGLVVLMQHGEPIGAVVNLEELLFILDARRAEDDDTLSGLEDPSSGQHKGWEH